MKKVVRRRLNKKRVFIALVIPILIICLIINGCNSKEEMVENKNLMIALNGLNLEEIENYCTQNSLKLTILEEYNSKKKGSVLSQSIDEGTEINAGDELIINISLGLDYESLDVNELGNVPVMMYHGIHDITDNEYTGGNVDKDGYQRTASAFRKDLEFYYNNGYRMVRLEDYVNGIIDVEVGLSPIVITFDDGLANNINVLGLDEKGEIIIDPNSAVGILEEYKKKYPDFNVTATFFVNAGLFRQSEYNEKILNWLVDNGYDIGNHSYSHADFTDISYSESVSEIGALYNVLDKYISGKYVNIVALPFGSPYKTSHDNFDAILKGKYKDKYYETISTLRVGWEADYSPFSENFDRKFIKRIRAYDNNGVEFDIEMNFEILERNRYISDGDKNTIVVPKSSESKLDNTYKLDVITY